jgi:hypothetical protein
MVKDESAPMDFGTESKPTKISVTGTDSGSSADHDIHDLGGHHDLGLSTPAADWNQPSAPAHNDLPGPDLPVAASELPASTPEHDEAAPAVITPAEPAAEMLSPEAPAELPAAPEAPIDHEPPAPAESASAEAPPPSEPLHNVEALHFQPERRRRGRGKFILLGLIILLVAVYLAIDAGLIASGTKLPFHIFTQKNNSSTATETAPPAAQSTPAPASTPSLPAGFTLYNLSKTDITFAAPTAWGQPSSKTEDGYSSRSATAKPDGTYAYLVTFATNKDVQVTVTSGKYLPPTRDATYYDYLQWCTGTNDGKFYESILHFTTTNGVDTPGTISCDQGPLANAAKLDDSTIVQLNFKDAKGSPVGDLYTKNLNEKDLPVLRVRDAAMKSGTDIKTLLGTVKTTGTISQ